MDEWVWSIGWMILIGDTEVVGEKYFTSSLVDEWMNMVDWRIETERGKELVGDK
jgi:hypothetical protein